MLAGITLYFSRFALCRTPNVLRRRPAAGDVQLAVVRSALQRAIRTFEQTDLKIPGLGSGLMKRLGSYPRPERVVTLITRLVLSPNSAGGAPPITSND